MLNEGVRQSRFVNRLGVSLVVCCHNGASLLPRTLEYLKRQKAAPDLLWEVILIDNASTDDTQSVARRSWGEDGPVALRVIHEERLGLCFARERGFREARYQVVSFVDDDNWITPHWINVVSEVMSSNPDVGAIGSVNRAVADVPLPSWFVRYCEFYACWASNDTAPLPTMLNGAGMTIRKSVWQELKRNAFAPQLTDRVGGRLSSCGDLELGLAIKLAGWKLHVEPRLELMHYMPEGRLQWSYLRRLLRGVGESNVVLDSYFRSTEENGRGIKNRLRERWWWWRFISESRRLLNRHSVSTLIRFCYAEMNNDDNAADMEWRLGRLIGLLRLRSRYLTLRHQINGAQWRKRDSPFWDLTDHSAAR